MSLPSFKAALMRLALPAVAVTLACGRPTQPIIEARGTVRITAITTGFPQDADGYRVLLGLTPEAPRQTQMVAANGVVLIERASPGEWRLFLDGMSSNCAATLPYPVEVVIKGTDTTEAIVRVQCGPQDIHPRTSRIRSTGSGAE